MSVAFRSCMVVLEAIKLGRCLVLLKVVLVFARGCEYRPVDIHIRTTPAGTAEAFNNTRIFLTRRERIY